MGQRRTPLRHRVITAVSFTLIAIAAVLIVAMVVSLFRGDRFYAHTEVLTDPTGGHTSHQRQFSSWRGRLGLAYVRADVVEESARHEKRWHVGHAALPREMAVSRLDAPGWLAWLGIDWRLKDRSSVDPAEGLCVYRELFVTVPHWLIAALLGGSGWALGAAPRRVRRRRRRGQCVACGYDLRGTPQRCPECGAAPESATA